jgi:hypothetical protein
VPRRRIEICEDIAACGAEDGRRPPAGEAPAAAGGGLDYVKRILTDPSLIQNKVNKDPDRLPPDSPLVELLLIPREVISYAALGVLPNRFVESMLGGTAWKPGHHLA